MAEWKECTIGDICNSVSETYSRHDNYVVLINTSDVLEGKFLTHQSSKNEDLKGQFKKTFQKDDILYSEIRPANKRYAFVDFDNTENYIASTKLMVIRPDKSLVLPKFLYLLLTSKNLIDEMQHLAETRSGTFPQITFSGELSTFPINLPPLTIQEKISNIFSAIDDKIELNNKINDNLEQQAQAIFKSWFVDFEPFSNKMPDGWKIGKLSEIAEITMGQSPDGKSYNEDGIGTVFYQGRAEFGLRFPTRRLFTTEPKRMAKKFDTLMSVRAPVGDTNIANEDCCIGRGLAAIHSKDNHQSFVHYTVLALRSQLDVFNGEGTVFGCINRDALNNMEVIIPSEKELNKFEQTVSSLDTEIFNRSEESQNLTNLRDTLLPKLMSGEIDVDSVQI